MLAVLTCLLEINKVRRGSNTSVVISCVLFVLVEFIIALSVFLHRLIVPVNRRGKLKEEQYLSVIAISVGWVVA